MSAKISSWRTVFLLAALFNYAIGFSIVIAPRWSYGLAWVPPLGPSGAMTLKFWFDFGAVVALIGVGYHMVSRDTSRNRGIVWLGIVSKIFDVATLTYRFAVGLGHPLVLIPAAIDGTFVVLFLLFLRRSRSVTRV